MEWRFLGEKGITYQTKCECLPDEAITRIYNGDNVLAVYGRNTGGPAFLDFGLYVENKTYSEADVAILKKQMYKLLKLFMYFNVGM